MKLMKKKQKSLQTTTFWTIFWGAVLVVVLITGVELFLHAATIMENYKSDSSLDIRYVLSMVDQEYLENLYAKTEEIYYSLDEEERLEEFTDPYRYHFIPLVDDTFLDYREIFVKCRENEELLNVAVVFMDEVHERMVYVIDGDTVENAYLPGQWLSYENAEIDSLETIRKIVDSKNRLSITYGKLTGFIATNYVDVYARDGSWLGYGVVDFSINDFFTKLFGFLGLYIPIMLAVILINAWLLSRHIRQRIIVPVDSLAFAAKVYTARDKVSETGYTNYFGQLNLNTDDELEDLWQAMVDMERDVSETMMRIREVTEEKLELKSRQERIANELSIATRIQEGILPSTFPAFPDRSEFDIYASMTPALEVGGDFYDYFFIDQDHLAIVIADVSGKGISASLFMVIAKTLLQNEAMLQKTDIPSIFTAVNRRLMEGNEAEMFVTCWMGIITISTGEVHYVNAGHEFPAIRHENGEFHLFKDIHGMPLAAMDFVKYREGEFTLERGDTLYVYTDGVTDANNPQKELFGVERVVETLNTNPAGTPREINDTVRNALAEFMQEEPAFDDTTMVILKYFGPKDEE